MSRLFEYVSFYQKLKEIKKSLSSFQILYKIDN